MYEQVSHSLLNEILTNLKPDIKAENIRHFYTRLGANFYSIYSLFYLLYGDRDDFKQQAQRLVETMARNIFCALMSTSKKTSSGKRTTPGSSARNGQAWPYTVTVLPAT